MIVFILSIIGTIATVIGAYFAWVAVRSPKWRSKNSEPDVSNRTMNDGSRNGILYDVFISYAHDDLEWVREFTERLGREGIRVARDEVVTEPGTVFLHAIEEAIRDSAHGLLVFSPASVASGWADQEYITLMSRSIEKKQLFIPVLIGAVTIDNLPEFARTRYFADFRHVSHGQYSQLVKRVAQAVRQSSAS